MLGFRTSLPLGQSFTLLSLWERVSHFFTSGVVHAHKAFGRPFHKITKNGNFRFSTIRGREEGIFGWLE